ncbi:hypothetical protein Skr01_16040 [Sphaerisporangium krabiense]|nr:hypothetical protein Skr01_16040 [Sphaerisporangium krabiense]
MRLSEQTWSTLISNVRLGRDEYRVVRPARAVKHAMLYEGRLGAQLSLDKPAAVVLAMAWGLAARSPHSLIYLPLRTARPVDLADNERLLDLSDRQPRGVRTGGGSGTRPGRGLPCPPRDNPRHPLLR